MNTILAVVAWLTVVAFFVLRQVLVSRRTLFSFDWYSLLLFFLALDYVFPVLAIFAGLTFPSGSYVEDYPGAAESALGAVLLLIFAIVSWVGYSVVRGPRLSSASPARPEGRLLVGLLLMMSAATVAWIIGFGGFVQAITSVMAIRFGTITNESSVPWFTGLTKAAWFAVVIAIDALSQSRRTPGRSRRLIVPYLLLGVSILDLLLTGSRGAIGNVLLSIALYGAVSRRPATEAAARLPRRKSGKMKLAAIVGAAITVVVLFKPVMTLIAVASTDYTLKEAVADFRENVRTGTSSDRGRFAVVGKVASDFSHFPILSTLAFEDDRAHPEDRDYGRDLYYGFSKLLPASIYEPGGVPLSFRSTYLILGTWESQIPPGVIAWLLFTAGPFGVLLGALLMGMVLALTERVTVQWLARSWWRQSGYIAFGITVAAGIAGGAPGDLFREVGSMIVVLVAAVLVGRLVATLPHKGAYGRSLRLDIPARPAPGDAGA